MNGARMESRVVPGLGREVSVVGAGCWTIGGLATNAGTPIGWAGVDPDDAFAALVAAHQRGVTLFDTADVYGMGASERLVGRLLREADRGELVVSSKTGYFSGTAAHPYLPSQILRQFETTCENLGTDYLDLYCLHSTDFGPADRYLDQALDTLAQLRAAGRIRAVGMRAPHTFAAEWATRPGHPHAAEAARFLHLFAKVQPDILTVRHNLLSPLYRDDETDVFAFARPHGTGFMIKQALGQGLLLDADRHSARAPYPPGDHRSRDAPPGAPFLAALRQAQKELVRHFGPDRSALIRVALRYGLAADPNAAVLVGFRDPEQITVNLNALGDPLDWVDIKEIRTVMAPVRDMLSTNPTSTNEQQENSA
jgi:aryl-alcohol dehydrogenase-like predicted oxidoreductase